MSEAMVELLQRQNRQLRERVEELEEEKRQRVALLVPEIDWPSWMPHLTPLEDRVLSVLASGRMLSRYKLLNVLYGDRPAPPDDKIIDVVIHHLRRKLVDTPLRIETKWGFGWKLAAEGLTALKAAA
jgi:DNA-binding response OmpR family regulator